MTSPALTGLREAAHALLAGYAPLTADLAVFLGKPAIFTNFLTPQNAPLPRVVIDKFVVDDSTDTVGTSERQPHLEIYIYASGGQNTSSQAVIERIAENVRSALHNIDPGLTGWTCISSKVTGPITAPTDETLLGRMLTVSYWFSRAF